MSLKLRKNRSTPMPETCAVGECMALLGGAWTPNVVWHLSGGARRFGELKRDMKPISAKMLSARLKDLEMKGVVSRAEQPSSPPSVEYALTPLGRELVPAIQAIVAVGEKLKAQAKGRVPARKAAE